MMSHRMRKNRHALYSSKPITSSLPPRKLEGRRRMRRSTTGGEGIPPPNVNNKSLRSVYYSTLSQIASTSLFSVHRIVMHAKNLT